ncbi:hypothetical protein ACS0TY_002399 [Phlomoides rotata]
MSHRLRFSRISRLANPLRLQGGWENDETAEEAAEREAVEEAGVRGDLVEANGDSWCSCLFEGAKKLLDSLGRAKLWGDFGKGA